MRINTDQPLASVLPKIPGVAQLPSVKDCKPAPPSPAPSTTSKPATPPKFTIRAEAPPEPAYVQEVDVVLDEDFARQLSEQAVVKALADARRKFCGIENQRRFTRKMEADAQPPAPRTAREIKELVLAGAHLLDDKIAARQRRGEVGYEVDPAVEPLFRLLCLYFARDPRFETEDETGQRKLHKGLLLTGNVGAGKTTLLRIFRQANPAAEMSFHEASYQELDRKFSDQAKGKGGLDALTPYYQQPYFIDDLGREPGESSHYAEHKNVVEVILEERNQRCKPSWQFHATTNLSELQIFRKYDKRIYSRFRENFNFLAFPPDAKDRRTGHTPAEFDAHIAALEALEAQAASTPA